MSIAELSIKRPITTIMLFVSMVVVGLIAAVRLPLESMPDVSAPFLYVMLPYPGSTPEETERALLRPAEETLATMTGVKNMQSNATSESAGVFLQFSDWSRDIAIATAEARERIDAIRNELPDDLRRYMVFKWSSADEAAITLRVSSRSLDLTREYDRLDRGFKRRLERIPGVAKVEIHGAPQNEVEIAVQPDRLSANGVSLDALAAKLQTVNFSVSAGEIDDGARKLRVQPQGELRDLDQLRELVLDTRGTRLSDIAEVRLKPVTMRSGRRLDGRPAVSIDIYKERDANLVQVSREVNAEVAAIKRTSAVRDITVSVVEDQGEAVVGSLLSLAEAGVIGLLLSIIVLYYFLRDWAATLMVTLAIPICFIMTLGFMYFAGVTLNVLTMMGLLLAIGMLVDNAVVVVESIYQEREKMPGQPRLASILGTRHVAIALTAGTLCHCIVFVPNLFGERDMISIYMAQIAITISVSLLASWLVAVSLIPMLSARLKTPPTLGNRRGFIHRLQERYAGFLRWTLEHRAKSVLGIVFIVAISAIPAVMTKNNMFGGDEAGSVFIRFQWKGAYTRARMSEEVSRVERYIEANRERFRVNWVSSRFSENGGAGVYVELTTKDPEATERVTEAIREGLPKSARADITLGRQDGPGGGMRTKKIEVRLVGDSTQMLGELATDVVPILARRPELRDVRVDAGDRNTELVVRVDRERAAAFGFSAQEVAGFVGMALRGQPLREFRRGDVEVPLTVRFADAERYDASDLAALTVKSKDGRDVPLMAMADVTSQPAAGVIQRTNRQTTLNLTANLAPGTTMPEARKAMESALGHVAWPAGYSYTFDRVNFMDESEAMRQMLFNLLIAVVMIYVVMAAVFESLLFPTAIMSGVVFSIFGVYWLFWLTGTEFNIMAFIGILVLMGVVVNNGIVMVEHINNHRRAGMSRTDALVAGSRERLRPILMTMGTAILAMIPIAIGKTQMAGDGPSYYPMARAIAGGLAFSTVVSLLFLPTIYAILDDWRANTARMWRRARGVSPPGGGAGAVANVAPLAASRQG
ncbi:efflux RND transporter permease subunit [Lysobacter pythonis]|uniref:Efflux RND transporter permease subunit n=1 Tax=Solilutibacter pythonis TaxID=2483112 RepID=A0A3M2HYN4_9GAMM|nr:efflux RND transporter permease subunit [Lysobacter pythonis]RMH94826.1 efflux RND transporter permease subunit [Lysobacter pythonis]